MKGAFFSILISCLTGGALASGQLGVFNSTTSLAAYGRPTPTETYAPTAAVIRKTGTTMYVWNDTCTRTSDMDMHVRPVANKPGCWERTLSIDSGVAITTNRLRDSTSALRSAMSANTMTAGSGITILSGVVSTTNKTGVSLPNITVSESAVVAISAGVRNVVVSCSGVVAGDILLVTPISAPAGYMIGSAVATSNNQITVQLYAPLLSIGSSYSITCKTIAFR